MLFFAVLASAGVALAHIGWHRLGERLIAYGILCWVGFFICALIELLTRPARKDAERQAKLDAKTQAAPSTRKNDKAEEEQ
ncbi:hypothetical protein RMS29_027900 (plasmid) [Agrobacterium rosae]|uniref:Uncharacterized protein n=1 Tax=Agrobacterium rosae TaxID=1972867 RepID=A0ABU4W4B5_9HYPH|nr:hypothetical protein [Agrobacterium rosae]MDX8332632.1 hypothetical protein [Agrobacterium rosae]